MTQDEFINGTKKWKVGKSLYEFFIRESAGVDPDDGYQMWYKDVETNQGVKTGEKNHHQRIQRSDTILYGQIITSLNRWRVQRQCIPIKTLI